MLNAKNIENILGPATEYIAGKPFTKEDPFSQKHVMKYYFQ